jgi:hypothetical protein
MTLKELINEIEKLEKQKKLLQKELDGCPSKNPKDFFDKFKKYKKDLENKKNIKYSEIKPDDWDRHFKIKGCEGIPQKHCETDIRNGKCEWDKELSNCINVKVKIQFNDIKFLTNAVNKKHDDLLKKLNECDKNNYKKLKSLLKSHRVMVKKANKHFNNIININIAERHHKELKKNWNNRIKNIENIFWSHYNKKY